jgi:hypothetical protein
VQQSLAAHVTGLGRRDFSWRFTRAQVRVLEAVLDAGPTAWGWEDQCWTLARIAEVVRQPVWSHLKRSLANLAKRNLAQLTALIKTRLKRMQYRPSLLDGFLASTRPDLAPP